MNKLDDLQDRVKQFIEVNRIYLERGTASPELVEAQERAFLSVLSLIRQLKKTGKINRGNEYFPDPVAAMLETETENEYQQKLGFELRQRFTE